MKKLNIEVGATSVDTKISIDGDQIGYIQSVLFRVSAYDDAPVLEVTFPDLEGYPSHAEVLKQIEKLKDFPNIDIKVNKLVMNMAAANLPDDPSELAQWDKIGNQ